MKTFFSRILITISTFLFAAEVKADAYGLNDATPSSLPKSFSIPEFLGKILGSVLGFTGTIFFVLVIVAGLMWMTSAGNEERVKRAKQILIAAVIGLIIVLSAYAITSFIGSNVVSQ